MALVSNSSILNAFVRVQAGRLMSELPDFSAQAYSSGLHLASQIAASIGQKPTADEVLKAVAAFAAGIEDFCQQEHSIVDLRQYCVKGCLQCCERAKDATKVRSRYNPNLGISFIGHYNDTLSSDRFYCSRVCITVGKHIRPMLKNVFK